MNKIAIIIMPYRNRAHPFAVNVHRKVQTYLHVHMRPKSGSYCDVRMRSRSNREFTQIFELERMLSYLNKDLDRQRLCHLKYVYIVTLTYLNLINHTKTH